MVFKSKNALEREEVMTYQQRDHRQNPCFGTLRSLVQLVQRQGECENEILILDPTSKNYRLILGTAGTKKLAEAHYAPCKTEFWIRLHDFLDQMMPFLESEGITTLGNALLIHDEMDLPRERIAAFNRLRDWVYTWADSRDRYHKGSIYLQSGFYWKCDDPNCSFH